MKARQRSGVRCKRIRQKEARSSFGDVYFERCLFLFFQIVEIDKATGLKTIATPGPQRPSEMGTSACLQTL